MIFNKSTVYPYPIYSNSSLDYIDPLFNVQIELTEESSDYYINFTTTLDSEFLKALLARGFASMYIVMTTFTTSEIFPYEDRLRFDKSTLDLGNKIRFQLYIIAEKSFTLGANNELDSYYRRIKDQIILKPKMLVGMSNIVNFNGQIKKPFELFSWKFNPNLDSEIKIELSTDEIIIHHKEKDYRFTYSDDRKFLNNHYIYLGLQKALLAMFHKNKDSEFIDLDDSSEELESSELDFKLINFLKAKNITSFAIDEIDHVISKISDGIVDKQAKAVRRITSYAD
jgi:hypothetical protein